MSLLFNTLGLSSLSCQEAIVFWLHGCSHCPQRFWSSKNEICHYFHLFPLICHAFIGLDAMIFIFFSIFSLKPALSLYSFILIKSLFSSSLLSTIRVVWSAYLRLLMFLPLIFLMMCSVYKLNKQGDSRQPCHTPFSILNQSVVPYWVLTVVSWPVYRFLGRQVRYLLKSRKALNPKSLHGDISSLWLTENLL